MELFLIAEIGINNNGDLGLAKQLITSASNAGFDAVKFQKRNVDKVYSQDFLDSPRQSPWGNTQRDQKEGLEFNFEEYEEINEFCRSINILWSASAWDLDSQVFIQKFNCSTRWLHQCSDISHYLN
jgi:N-acetylneuraminate synthase